STQQKFDLFNKAVQLFKTCWRTNFFKPLLKRSDAVVAVKKWLKPERVKFARGEP
ncbi:TPA: hypothetical protein ACU5DP_005613, partial [Klebsiella pneumoniae]